MPALKEDRPETMISLASVTLMLAQRDASHHAEKLAMQKSFARKLDQATQDGARHARSNAFQAHAQGRFDTIPLTNDPYRDLSATLAEVRTETFALKLVADDQDGYRVTGSVSLRQRGVRTHSLRREFAGFDEASDYYRRAAARFGGQITDFRTQVDY